MSGEAVLITGAGGFLARAAARLLADPGRAAALIRPGGTRPPGFATCHDDVAALTADLKRVDVVLHLAACIPVPLGAEPPELVPTNVDLVARLAAAYPKARHVLASSVAVYGIPASLPLSLRSAPDRPNAYGRSKLAAEEIVRRAPSHAILRFSSLVGKGMKGGSFIPAAVAGARAGTIRLVGGGERLQNYLDIDDAARMCLRAAETGPSFAALGVGPRSYSNNEVAAILAELTGAAVVREGEDRSPSFVYDPADALDFGQPATALRETLAGMVRE